MSGYLPERYAQRRAGRKLHVVSVWPDGAVALTGRCGVRADERGHWRMTINVPLANACRNCLRSRPRFVYDVSQSA